MLAGWVRSARRGDNVNGEETGQGLGKYQIVEEIGRGGFATVYRAVDTTLDRQVALKVLDPLLMRDQNWVTRFQREAKAVARLKHPHIITIFEIGEADGQLFIAMELVEGPGLDVLIAERGGLPWEETLEILAQVAQALDYAHGEGIVHRDLKPANILLDPRKGAMLTDFGFARLVGESSMSVSLSGGVVGTPAYIAPEVWDGKDAAPQTDLYSLACIAYEMLMGKVLFDGQTPSVVMRQHLIDGPHFPERWPDGVPGGVEAVLARGLAQEAGDRVASAGRLVSELGALPGKPRAAAASTRRPGEAPVALSAETDRKPWLAPALLGVVGLAAVGLLVVGAVAALVVFGMRSGGHPTPTPAVAVFPTEPPVPAGTAAPPTSSPANVTQERSLASLPTPTRYATYTPPGPAPTHTLRPSNTPPAKGTHTPIPPTFERQLTWGDLQATAQAPASSALPTARHTDTPIPAPTAGDVFIRLADEMEMVYVPEGEFTMGSPDGEGDSDEHPQHTVSLGAFWIDRYEVTNDQFRQCVEAGACVPPTTCDSGEPTYGEAEKRDHPVVCVNWHDAEAYCRWTGARLPTEAEWEKAARGTDGRRYPWGDEWDVGRCNTAEGGKGGTMPVGSHSPTGDSPYGCADMAGNVWEWVADWYDGDYYSRSPDSNPPGPNLGDYRVVRGGSWFSDQLRAHSANRRRHNPGYSRINYGFRCSVS